MGLLAKANIKPLPGDTFVNQYILETQRKTNMGSKIKVIDKMEKQFLMRKITRQNKQEDSHPQELEIIKQIRRCFKIIMLQVIK